MESLPSIVVVIASKGRPDDLALWLGHMARQSFKPVTMIWSVTGDADLPLAELAAWPEADKPQVIIGGTGLCRQRNAALDALPEGADIIAFFDDDYIPCDDCLENMARFMEANPDVVGVTGKVLADGINGPGVSVEDAMALTTAHRSVPLQQAERSNRVGLYGCNMAMRINATKGLRFDENLPLYGWQEDVDFAGRLRQRGMICGTNAFAGVHRGAKSGRTSGVRLGYSQIANIIYLVRKGSMPVAFGCQLMARNLLANHVKVLRPEPWVDRRGRVDGNWLALRDLVSGRLHPLRILEI